MHAMMRRPRGRDYFGHNLPGSVRHVRLLRPTSAAARTESWLDEATAALSGTQRGQWVAAPLGASVPRCRVLRAANQRSLARKSTSQY